MAVTVRGKTIVATAAADSYDDWIKVKECRWQGGADNATLLVQDKAAASRILKSKADQDDFIDVVRPDTWYKGFVITTMTSGEVTFYVE
jgi:hypothetical protein